jgi:hypothetical protein
MNEVLIIIAGIGAANAIVNEYIFTWLRKILPNWNWLQILFDCTTCMSFWTTLILGLCFSQGWWSLILALTASLLARMITIWEEK